MRIFAVLIGIICLSPLAIAEDIPSGSYWECSAEDANQKMWTLQASHQRLALNNAMEACKKESTKPGTCRAPQEQCEPFLNGKNIGPMWQCTALDLDAKPWISNPYRHRDDAAIASKAYCHDHSAFPDSCYINLLTCKNINARR
ncbi:MAG: hypothetical protein Q8R79_08160 [Legionellaceae bacterium]|nr:hypothetical protein [Legionellaceae bacterium]